MYTFLLIFKGGEYCSQYSGKNVNIALNKWLEEEVDKLFPDDPKIKKHFKESLDEEVTVVGQGFIKNVWATSFISKKSFGSLWIVKTKTP